MYLSSSYFLKLTYTYYVALFLVSDEAKTGKQSPNLLSSLQGEWKATLIEEKGDQDTSKKEVDREGVKMVIKNNHLIFYKSNRHYFTATIQLDESANPIRLDFKLADGGINHAIIKIENKRLLLCVSHRFKPNSPENRPISYTSAENMNNPKSKDLLFMEFERVKK